MGLGNRLSDRRTAHLFILPLVVVMVVFIVVPVAGTFVTSFFRDITYLEPAFTFLANYKRLASDAGFWQSMRFTSLFVAVCIPVELLLGMVFALILNERLPARGVLRAAVLVPWAIPTIVAARTWELIYNYSYGLANWVLALLHAAPQPVNWLGSPLSAFGALVIADVWKTTPCFFRITLPILRPVIAVALIFRTIDTIRILDLIYVVTDGGPGGSTTSLSLYGYKFFNEGDFGYGSTIAVVVFVMAFLLSMAYLRAGGFKGAVE